MKNITKIRVHSAGVVAILKSGTVAADVAGRAAAIRSRLPTGNGEEWAVHNVYSRDRAKSIVRAANYEAREAAATRGVMQGALGAGR